MSEFKDVIVLELASVLAGPGVGQFFAELGAQVIKVENIRTSGDVTRSWRSADESTDDRSAYFCSVNWGKQSIALDLASPEGQGIVHRLARRAAIVITSFKPGDDVKLGVDYETLSRGNPELVYGQITGYGTENQRVGYDAIIQAEAGFMYMNGSPGGSSLKIPVALMDVLAGHHLKEGILLALLEKTKTGKGKKVEVSLIQAAVASLANQATNYLIAGKIPEKQGSAHPNIAPYGDVFLTEDGKEILLAVGTDSQFKRLVKILDVNDLISDFSYQTNVLRVKNRDVLTRVLAGAIKKTTADSLLKLLHSEKIPAGIVRNMREVMADAAVAELLLEDGAIRGLRSFVAHGDRKSFSHVLPPPHLGEHTAMILADLLKFSPSEVKSLIHQGIIK